MTAMALWRLVQNSINNNEDLKGNFQIISSKKVKGISTYRSAQRSMANQQQQQQQQRVLAAIKIQIWWKSLKLSNLHSKSKITFVPPQQQQQDKSASKKEKLIKLKGHLQTLSKTYQMILAQTNIQTYEQVNGHFHTVTIQRDNAMRLTEIQF